MIYTTLTLPPSMMGKITPKIYVACKASYDCGYFCGDWIDLIQDLEVIQQAISKILLDSPIPNSKDWIILQHEGFGNLHLGRYEDIIEIHKKAVLISKFGDLCIELLSYYGGNAEDAADALDNRYQGDYEDELEFAMQLFDFSHANSLPESLKWYIDYGCFQRDIVNDYFALKVGCRVHVFLRF